MTVRLSFALLFSYLLAASAISVAEPNPSEYAEAQKHKYTKEEAKGEAVADVMENEDVGEQAGSEFSGAEGTYDDIQENEEGGDQDGAGDEGEGDDDDASRSSSTATETSRYSHRRRWTTSFNRRRSKVTNCYGYWTSYSKCTKTCGTGYMFTKFYVTVSASGGGKACNYNHGETFTVACNTKICPVNCVGAWSVWGECSRTCGGGIARRTYKITTWPKAGGSACPLHNYQVMTGACNPESCPTSGTTYWKAAWSSACPVGRSLGKNECKTAATRLKGKFKGAGRFRYAPPGCLWWGTKGANLYFNRNLASTFRKYYTGNVCKTVPPTPVDCVGAWSEWTACSRSCATSCAGVDETKRKRGRLSNSTADDAECGSGVRSRTYTLTVEAVGTGKVCPAKDAEVFKDVCGTQACPVDCEGTWSDWTLCSKPCGGGLKTRTFSVSRSQMSSGAKCVGENGNFLQNGDAATETCNTEACPQDCSGSWEPWTTCSKTCGGGLTSRTFDVAVEKVGNGTECYDDDPTYTEESPGYTQLGSTGSMCRGDAWNAGGYPQNQGYKNETECRALCDADSKCTAFDLARESATAAGKFDCWLFAHFDVEASTGAGAASDGKCFEKRPKVLTHGVVENDDCNKEVCPVDCVGAWADWDACSLECGGGTKARTFEITIVKQGTGADCTYETGNAVSVLTDGYEQEESCNTLVCPVDCEGEWSAWTTCEADCGNATQSRTFKITVSQAGAGDACEHEHDKTESKRCGPAICPVDCKGDWGDWGTCSEDCGGGVQTRTYAVTITKVGAGAQCTGEDGTTVLVDGQEGEQVCNPHVCPVDCVGEWGSWTACSKTCGAGGHQTRLFEVSVKKKGEGQACTDEDGTTTLVNQTMGMRACDNGACPIDCEGNWGSWTECTASCGVGTKTRVFNVTTQASGNGKICTNEHEDEDDAECNTDACDVDCPDNSVSKDGEDSGGTVLTSGCECDAGYTGEIIAKEVAPWYDGTCEPVPCSEIEHSSGTTVPSEDGCTCDDGYSGDIVAMSDTDTGKGYAGACEAHAPVMTSKTEVDIQGQSKSCGGADCEDTGEACAYPNKILTLEAEDQDGDAVTWYMPEGDAGVDGAFFRVTTDGEVIFCNEKLDYLNPVDHAKDNSYHFVVCATDAWSFTVDDCNGLTINVLAPDAVIETTTTTHEATTTTAAPTTTTTEEQTTTTQLTEDNCHAEKMREALDKCNKAKVQLQEAVQSLSKAGAALKEQYAKPERLGCWAEGLTAANTAHKNAWTTLQTAQDTAVKQCKRFTSLLPQANGTTTCAETGLIISGLYASE